MRPMDLGSRIKSGVRWLGVGKATVQIYTWVLTILTMRILEPHVYGLLAIATIFLSFLSLFEELGLRMKLVQMKEFTTEYLRSLYGLSIVTNGILACSLMVAAPLIAVFFKQAELKAVIIVLASQFLVSSLAVIPDAMIKRQLDFRTISIVDIAQAVSAATLTLFLAARGFGVWSLVYGTIAGTVVRTLSLVVASPFRAWPSFNFAGLGPTLRFGGLVTASRLVWWAFSNLDRFLIGRFFDTHLLGVYSGGAQLATMPLDKVGSILNLVSFAGLARAADDLKAFRHYLLRACRLVALMMFPVFFGIAAIAREVVPVVFGPRWLGMETVMAILALSVPARSLSLPLIESLNSLGKPQEVLKCSLVAAVMYVTGILLGLSWGLQGIATGIVLAGGFTFATNLRIVEKNTRVSTLQIVKEVWKPLLASIAMLCLLLVLRPVLPLPFPTLGGLCLSIGVGGAFYLGLIALIDREGFLLLVNLVRPTRFQ